MNRLLSVFLLLVGVVASLQAQAQSAPGIRLRNNGFSDFTATSAARVGTDVSVRAYETPVGVLLRDIARTSGYTLSVGSGLDMNRRVSPAFSGLTPVEAMSALAQLAGYRIEGGAPGVVIVSAARVGASETWTPRR